MEINRPDAVEFERWERIDNTVYDMSPPPTSEHQNIISNLLRELGVYLKGGPCKVFPAPFGVWLDANETGNYVEPDISVVCDPQKIQHKGCVGVPDMIVEVLSPSTALKDKTVKLRAYKVSGVQEYWIVDGSNQIVEVYMLSENVFGEPQIYGNNETIKVGIFSDLKICLQDIFNQ